MLGRVINSDDLTTPERAEQIRRSVAMLQPGQLVATREETMMLLGLLVRLLRAARQDGPEGRPTRPPLG